MASVGNSEKLDDNNISNSINNSNTISRRLQVQADIISDIESIGDEEEVSSNYGKTLLENIRQQKWDQPNSLSSIPDVYSTERNNQEYDVSESQNNESDSDSEPIELNSLPSNEYLNKAKDTVQVVKLKSNTDELKSPTAESDLNSKRSQSQRKYTKLNYQYFIEQNNIDTLGKDLLAEPKFTNDHFLYFINSNQLEVDVGSKPKKKKYTLSNLDLFLGTDENPTASSVSSIDPDEESVIAVNQSVRRRKSSAHSDNDDDLEEFNDIQSANPDDELPLELDSELIKRPTVKVSKDKSRAGVHSDIAKLLTQDENETPKNNIPRLGVKSSKYYNDHIKHLEKRIKDERQIREKQQILIQKMVQRVDDLEKIIEGPINQSALNLSSNVDLSKPTKLNTTLLKMENEELTARVDAKQLELEKYIENSNFNSSQVQSLRVDLEDLEETVEYQQEEILTLRQLNKDLQLKVESNQEFKNVTPGKDSQQNIAVSDQERNMDLQKISGLEKVISLLQDENRAITDSLRLANIEVSDLKKTTEDSINVKESAELLKSLICSLAKFSNQSVSSSQKSENENEVKKIWATANKSQNDLVKEAITSLMENIKKMGEYQEYKVLIESQVTHLREKLKISESDYREELDKLTSQINVLEKNVTNQQPQVLQLQSMEKQMVELKNIVMEQQEKLDDAVEEKRLKEFKIMELEKRLMETNATQQLQEKILLNEMEIKQLREQVKLMSSRDAEMANIKSNIQREKDMLQQEIVDLQSTIDSLYSKIAQSKSAAAAKESEFEEIRMNLEEELHLMREKQKNKGKVVEEDPSKTLTLSNSLQEAKKELQELRTTFKTETDNHLVLKSHLESELQSAQSKIKEITVEFDLLSSNHKETLKLMEKLKLDTASELAESNSELGEKFTAVLVELDAERKNSQGIFQKYEKLKIETEKCEMFFDSIGKRFDVLLQESEQINDPKLNHLDYPTGDHTKLSKQQILIENKINEISSFISKKSSELANMHKNYSQLQESLSQSQNDTESKEFVLKDNNQKLSILQSELEDLESKNTTLANKLHEEERKHIECQKLKDSFVRELETVKWNLADRENVNASCKDRIETLETELEKLNNEAKQSDSKLKKIDTELISKEQKILSFEKQLEQFSSLKNQLGVLEAEIMEKNQIVAKLNLENSKMFSRCQSTEESHIALKQKYKLESQLHESQISDLKSQNAKLVSEIDNLMLQIRDFESQNQRDEKIIREMKSQRDMNMMELNELQSKLEETQKSIVLTKKKNDLLESEIIDLNHQRIEIENKFKRHLSEHNQKMEDSIALHAKSEQEIETKQAHINSLKRQLNDQEIASKNTQSELYHELKKSTEKKISELNDALEVANTARSNFEKALLEERQKYTQNKQRLELEITAVKNQLNMVDVDAKLAEQNQLFEKVKKSLENDILAIQRNKDNESREYQHQQNILRKQFENSENLNNELEIKIKSLEKANRDYKVKEESQMEELLSLHETLDAVRLNEQFLKNSVAQKLTTIELTNNDLKKLDLKFHEIQTAYKEAARRVEELEHELKMEKANIASFERIRSEHSETILHMEDEILKHKESLEKLRISNRTMEKSIDEERQQFNQSKIRYDAELSNLRNQILTLNKDHENSDQIKHFENIKCNLEDQCFQLQGKIKSLNVKVIQLEEENRTANTEIQRLKSTNNQLKESNEVLYNKMSTSDQKAFQRFSHLTEEREELVEEKIKLEYDQSSLVQKLRDSQRDLSKLQVELEAAKKSIHQLNESKDTLERRLKDSNSLLELREKEYKQFRIDTNAQIISRECAVVEFQSKLTHDDKQLRSSQLEKEEIEEKLNAMIKKLEISDKNVAEKTKKLVQLQQELDDEINNSRFAANTVKGLNKDIEQKSNEITTLNETITKLTNQIKTKEFSIRELETKILSRDQEGHAELLIHYQSQIASNKDTIMELKGKLQDQKFESNQQLKSLNILQNSLTEKHNIEMKKIKETVMELEEIIRNDTQLKNSEIDGKLKEIATLKQDRDILKGKLSEHADQNPLELLKRICKKNIERANGYNRIIHDWLKVYNQTATDFESNSEFSIDDISVAFKRKKKMVLERISCLNALIEKFNFSTGEDKMMCLDYKLNKNSSEAIQAFLDANELQANGWNSILSTIQANLSDFNTYYSRIQTELQRNVHGLVLNYQHTNDELTNQIQVFKSKNGVLQKALNSREGIEIVDEEIQTQQNEPIRGVNSHQVAKLQNEVLRLKFKLQLVERDVGNERHQIQVERMAFNETERENNVLIDKLQLITKENEKVSRKLESLLVEQMKLDLQLQNSEKCLQQKDSMIRQINMDLELSNEEKKTMKRDLEKLERDYTNLARENIKFVKDIEVLKFAESEESKILHPDIVMKFNAMEAEIAKLMNYQAELIKALNSKPTSNVKELKATIAKLKSELRLAEKNAIAVQEKLKSYFNKELESILLSFDKQMKERDRNDEERVKNEALLRASYEKRIKSLNKRVSRLSSGIQEK